MIITIELDESWLPQERGPYSRSFIEREITVSGETHTVRLHGFVPSTEDSSEFWSIMAAPVLGKAAQVLQSR